MTKNLKAESTAKAWAWRVAMGPAQILDGLLSTVTLGTIGAGLALTCARNLAQARIVSSKG